MKFFTGLILIALGLIFKASSEEANSTQSYYVEIQLEAAAYDNFTKILQNIPILAVNQSSVINITITTECDNVSCNCTVGNSWSDEVCLTSKCCQKQTCKKPLGPMDMCLSDQRVNISGSLTLPKLAFTGDLATPNSPEYKTTSKYFTEQMKAVFSTFDWFHSLKVTGFRQGSVIVDFTMLLTAPFSVSALQDKVDTLHQTLNATFVIVTKGYVKVENNPDDQKPFPYSSSVVITCSTPQQIADPKWYLNGTKDITTGTESTVTTVGLKSTVSIKNLSEVWEGAVTCDYIVPNTSNIIIHRGSVDLDIALLPQITIFSEPQFPSCKNPSVSPEVTVKCMVPYSTEPYNVTWDNATSDFNETMQDGQAVAYKGKTKIYCDSKSAFITVQCTFINRLQQSQRASWNIFIIYGDTPVCTGDYKWPESPTTATAILLCPSGSVGLEKRTCRKDTSWDVIHSECVNTVLRNILDDAQNLQRGIGIVAKNAYELFDRLKVSTENSDTATYSNVNASVQVMHTMNNASKIQNSSWNGTVFDNFIKLSSHLLNSTVITSFTSSTDNSTLGVPYLTAIEGVLSRSEISSNTTTTVLQENVQLIICNDSSNCKIDHTFNVTIKNINANGIIIQTAFKNLGKVLPYELGNKTVNSSEIVLLVRANETTSISMDFNYERLRNHKLFCVYLNVTTNMWSSDGCKWGGVEHESLCTCDHLTSFSILMSKEPITLFFADELTYAGLGVSCFSLTLCLLIEFLVWNTVVKSNISHFRHTVLVNIMLCLLIAYVSFLASPTPGKAPQKWCLTLTVIKHFCFLSAFFWMLCLSMGLLHQVIFVFVHLRKKVYLGLSIFLGYVCPLIIVMITFITYDNGTAGVYYENETCWLKYEGLLKGSIHAFVFPVGVIVIVNMFTMVVVISRILKPTISEGSTHDEKEVARSIVKTLVFLTPTLGITWILGFFVLMLDLTQEPLAQIVNYAFIFFNSFQGFFILLTGCLGEKKVREALLKRVRSQQSVYKSESSTRITAATKKK